MKNATPFVLPLFRSILFISAGLLLMMISGGSLEETSRWWSIVCTISNIITIALLVAVFKREGTTYGEIIGYHKDKSSSKFTLKIIVIMILLGIGGMYGFGFLIYGYIPLVMIQPIPVWLAAVNLILLPITTVFAELPLYFGYSLKRIDKLTGNKVLSIAYPMFFYALQHSFIPLLFEWEHILFRFLSFLPLMLVLGALYYKKRNLTPFMIGHGILDLSTGIQILVTSLSPALFEAVRTMQ